VIRIHKPAAPTKLIQDGSKKAEAHLQDYLQDPIAYETGKKKFNFSAKIYAHSSVKIALIKAQHKKCCFCERLIGEDGDIEHFRPKSAYRQKPKPALNYPGYYWLAYDWENLYLSCGPCNQRHKKNWFPIVSQKNRAQLNNNDCSLEMPLLINPSEENPSQHISFRGEIPYARPKSKKGETTIALLKLDRPILNQARLNHLEMIKQLYQIIQKAKYYPNDLDWKNVSNNAQKFLQDAILDSAEFAAATRCAIADGFGRVNIV
jgi:uncharacterized protein (TIGR02646 family)